MKKEEIKTTIILTRIIKTGGECSFNVHWENSNPDEVIGILNRIAFNLTKQDITFGQHNNQKKEINPMVG